MITGVVPLEVTMVAYAFIIILVIFLIFVMLDIFCFLSLGANKLPEPTRPSPTIHECKPSKEDASEKFSKSAEALFKLPTRQEREDQFKSNLDFISKHPIDEYPDMPWESILTEPTRPTPPMTECKPSRKEPCCECGRPLSKYFKGDDNEL